MVKAWKNKRCPRCGSEVDAFDSCTRCARKWSEKLFDSEIAIDGQGDAVPDGKQYHPYAVKEGNKKPKARAKRKQVFSEDLPDNWKAWEINPNQDDETEIVRKRSLMRLDSRRIYSAMGIAVKAHEAQRAALLWVSRLWETLDDDEKTALTPFVERLKISFDVLAMVRGQKIAQATKMERVLEAAYTKARQARLNNIERQKKATKYIEPGQDTEGLGLIPVELNPTLLLQQAEERLLALDKAKGQVKETKQHKAEFLGEGE